MNRELREILREDGEHEAWRRLLDFVDDSRGSLRPGQEWLASDELPPFGDARFDAAAGGPRQAPMQRSGPCPGGRIPGRFVGPWWFVTGLRGYEATAFRASPVDFKRHGVFVNEGAFD